MDLNEIKEHWRRKAQEFKTELKATTKGATIKKLEIKALQRAIQSLDLPDEKSIDILEVGCGNGYNCFTLADLFPGFSFTGVDYVPEMIESAKELQSLNKDGNNRVNFLVGDIMKLSQNKNIKDGYDIIFTDRCLINLNSLELQLKAFDQLVGKVKRNGYLILIENIIENYQNQNACRISVGLPPRTPDSYNLFINQEMFLEHSAESVELIQVDDFASLHDIVLYVLIPMINNGEVDYDNPMLKAVTEFSLVVSSQNMNKFGSFGQNRLFLFRKK